MNPIPGSVSKSPDLNSTYTAPVISIGLVVLMSVLQSNSSNTVKPDELSP